ncbi:hypothetical protein GCM10025795_02460 [Verticiella sediminum]
MSLKRDPAMQERLDAWGVWRYSGGYAASSPLADFMGAGGGDSDGVPRSFVPVDALECARTDEAVRALPTELRQAVGAWHGTASGTLDAVAHGLGIVRGTLHRRLCYADQRLAEWFAARVAASRAARETEIRRDILDRA